MTSIEICIACLNLPRLKSWEVQLDRMPYAEYLQTPEEDSSRRNPPTSVGG
jgi:hypothetical protein